MSLERKMKVLAQGDIMLAADVRSSDQREGMQEDEFIGTRHEGIPRVEFRSVQVTAGRSKMALEQALAQNPGYRSATFKELELAANNPEVYPELLEGNTYGEERKQRLWVYAFEQKGKKLIEKGMFFKYGIWLPIWGPRKVTEESHWDAEITRVLLVKETDTQNCGCAKRKREDGLKYMCACLNPVEASGEKCEACQSNQHREWMSV